MDREWFRIFAELDAMSDGDIAAMTPSERISWAWPTTVKHWWETKGIDATKMPFRRDIEGVIRRSKPADSQ